MLLILRDWFTSEVYSSRPPFFLWLVWLGNFANIIALKLYSSYRAKYRIVECSTIESMCVYVCYFTLSGIAWFMIIKKKKSRSLFCLRFLPHIFRFFISRWVQHPMHWSTFVEFCSLTRSDFFLVDVCFRRSLQKLYIKIKARQVRGMKLSDLHPQELIRSLLVHRGAEVGGGRRKYLWSLRGKKKKKKKRTTACIQNNTWYVFQSIEEFMFTTVHIVLNYARSFFF